MKSPSKSIAKSVAGHKSEGRGEYNPAKTPLPGGGLSMTVPGDGDTTQPAGAEGMERSAAKAANAVGPIGRISGGGAG